MLTKRIYSGRRIKFELNFELIEISFHVSVKIGWYYTIVIYISVFYSI